MLKRLMFKQIGVAIVLAFALAVFMPPSPEAQIA